MLPVSSAVNKTRHCLLEDLEDYPYFKELPSRSLEILTPAKAKRQWFCKKQYLMMDSSCSTGVLLGNLAPHLLEVPSGSHSLLISEGSYTFSHSLRISLLTTHKTCPILFFWGSVLLHSLGYPKNHDPPASAMSTGITGQCYHPGKPVQFYLNLKKKYSRKADTICSMYIHI